MVGQSMAICKENRQNCKGKQRAAGAAERPEPPGPINSAAETLGVVDQARIVCGRWRCWRTWGYRPYGFYRPWRRRYWW